MLILFWVKLGCVCKVGEQLTQFVGLPEGFKIWSPFLRSHFSNVFRHNSRAVFFRLFGRFACVQGFGGLGFRQKGLDRKVPFSYWLVLLTIGVAKRRTFSPGGLREQLVVFFRGALLAKSFFGKRVFKTKSPCPRAASIRGCFSILREAAQPSVKLTRLRLWGCDAVFGLLVAGEIGLRLQSRRAAYANRWAARRVQDLVVCSSVTLFKDFRHNSQAGVFACSVALPAFRVLAVSVFGKRVLTEKSRFRLN